MAPRTVGALALRPTGNIQGNFFFFSLSTGRVLNRQNATTLPMPNEVVDRVHLLARRQKANPGLVFLDRHQQPFDDDDGDGYDFDDAEDDDDDYVPPVDDDSDLDDDSEFDDDGSVPPVEHEGVIDGNAPIEHQGVIDDDAPNEDEGVIDEIEDVPDNNIDEAHNGAAVIENDDDAELNDIAVIENYDDANLDDVSDDGDADAASIPESSDDDNGEVENVETLMDDAYGKRTSSHNLRPRRRRSYSHLHVKYEEFDRTHLEMLNEGVDCSKVCTTGVDDDKPLATPQMTMQRGIKLFGDDGVKAVADELKQLHDRVVLQPKHTKELTPEQRQDALAYLMFLKRTTWAFNPCGTGCTTTTAYSRSVERVPLFLPRGLEFSDLLDLSNTNNNT